MTEEARKARNQTKMQDLNPAFRSRLSKVITDLEAVGFRPRIQCAWRSPQEQLEAYKSGHSQLRWGYHNATTPDDAPDSLAVDMLDDDFPLTQRRQYVLALAFFSESNGLKTGIYFGVPKRMLFSLQKAIINWQMPDETVKLGWDSCHVQMQGLTIKEAKKGRRVA